MQFAFKNSPYLVKLNVFDFVKKLDTRSSRMYVPTLKHVNDKLQIIKFASYEDEYGCSIFSYSEKTTTEFLETDC